MSSRPAKYLVNSTVQYGKVRCATVLCSNLPYDHTRAAVPFLLTASSAHTRDN